jgi:hypothetical protein
MIVYRDQRSRADPRLLLNDLRAITRRFTAAPPHDIARTALISTGKLEAAVADALFQECDGVNPLTRALGAASLAAGHAVWHTWHAAAPGADQWWGRLGCSLETIPERQLPSEVELTSPEGYAQYAVYPEMYLEAAKKFYAEVGSTNAVCIGLRSIGTSLSAMVSATLEELGSIVHSVSIRPRGHPFSRHPKLTAELQHELRTGRDRYYLVIDEGPGISGSSIAGTAALLREWGVADDRIVIFPSWQSDGSQLRSELARQTWSRYRQFTAPFESVWLESGRLVRELSGDLSDLSGGAWRSRSYANDSEYPAVQPQHERRKYLVQAPHPGCAPALLKFLGLGEEPVKKMCRAQRLAEAGYTPESGTMVHGFMLRPFVSGTPLRPGELDGELLEVVASYLAHLSREHRTQPTVTREAIAEMVEVNLGEGLGAWSRELGAELNGEWEGRVVALDGRMLAHEWIRTEQGYLKVDAVEHHDDHFFPGCQDIAWDLAAASIELNLDGAARQTMLDRYRSLSGDRTIVRRLPFYSVAYLAFRLGYCTLAAEVLGDLPDSRRFKNEVKRYQSLIREQQSYGAQRYWGG